MSGERSSRGLAGKDPGAAVAAREIRRIVVLNRGDAATRCLRAIRELRVEERSDLVGIALYTDVDQSNPFVREADEAVSLGQPIARAAGTAARLAYLDQERLLQVLRASRADAVWPGWGFLAEDAAFAERLRTAGIAFIGPSAETLRAVADKMHAKRLAERAGVPVLPWSAGSVGPETLHAEAGRIGYPLVIKAALGGGGRGIRRVATADRLAAAFQSAAAEAAAAFGDGTIYLEKGVEKARHVEVQFAADRHGGLLALGLRDCSVQRRHQKVVEEGPPGLPEPLARDMREAALGLAREVGYVGLGTCEFLVTGDGAFYFLEVNPRLQVEHGVTEALTGLDLVKLQFRIARGERLPEAAPEERGHAIEVRLCAEDPAADFAPTPGRVALLELPSGPGLRVDPGVAQHGVVPLEFDSMIARIIAHGATREEARARLIRALLDVQLVIEGGTSNKGFLLDVLDHPDFIAGRFHTRRLSEGGIGAPPPPRIEALLAAAVLTYQQERGRLRANFFAEASRGRPHSVPPSLGARIALVYGGRTYRLEVFAIGGWNYLVVLDGRVTRLECLELGPGVRRIVRGNNRSIVFFSESEIEFKIEIDGRTHHVQRDIGGKVRAGAPALLIEIAVKPGDEVEAGDRLGLLESMKTETTFVAPISGTVREILARPGVQVSAGQDILIIEPRSAGEAPLVTGPALALEVAPDGFDAFMDPETGRPDLARASALGEEALGAVLEDLGSQIRRILLGYDVDDRRAQRIVAFLDAPLDGIGGPLPAALARLAGAIPLFADLEALFSRAPVLLESGELGPSNDARMTLYLRRIAAEGAGIDTGFLDQLRRALAYYGVPDLEPTDALFRAVLRLCATRTTLELRSRIVLLLLNLLIRLVRRGELFSHDRDLLDALDHLVRLRGAFSNGVSDLAAYAHHLIVEGPGAERRGRADGRGADPAHTRVPPPDPDALARQAADIGLDLETAERMEIWRLAGFELKPLETLPGLCVFRGRARDQIDDERIFCFAEVNDLGPDVPFRPDTGLLERRFRQAIALLRSIQGLHDPNHRLHWNRLYVFLRPPVVVGEELVDRMIQRLAPETSNLGLEKVVVRYAALDARDPGAPPQIMELVAENPTGVHVETSLRLPHLRPLETATPYERNVARARARGLLYPYEVVRLFTAYEPDDRTGPARPTGPGEFIEHDLVDGRALPVQRPFGENSCGIALGTIRTPTAKYPEGMRRVLILSDPTRRMGALTPSECDRITAAIDLAERERIPVEWVAVSSGAHIAMDSGTENLDATARVVRRIVTFTDAGGEINLILTGVNVGAQSYFDALATMAMESRGILIMLTNSSMVLTGVAALEASGGVAAEDELGIGGYERTMGANGEAHYQASDITSAYETLLNHYACSYRMPSEPGPRPYPTRDPADRDVTRESYEGDEGFASVGEIFSAVTNAGRKRPFAMRPLMRAVVDADTFALERWRDWSGAEGAIVWETHIGGYPATLVGIESRPIARLGHVSNDGPQVWTAGTLFPQSSKKAARAINAASGNRPVVILANLSGFDGSPESMRRGILEFGAEIARAVVRFQGKILFTVVSRYHGGAYVVFSRELNEGMRATALTGSYASVIGGAAAAAVVFLREVRRRASSDPQVIALNGEMEQSTDPASRAMIRARLAAVLQEVERRYQAEVAAEFDAVHTVERALTVGSLERIIEPERLRPEIIRLLADAG